MVGLYLRVSTDEQAEHGFSIDFQKERAIAYAMSQGWNDYRLYIDDGYSGTNTDRPELQRLIKHIKDRRIEVVVVYKLDRLGRKQLDVLSMLEMFDNHGVVFKSVTEPIETSTPFGRAMIGILTVFAQLERDTIIERTREGRRKRIRSGLWQGGRIPFPYRWNRDAQSLELIPDQAEILREASKMFLRGISESVISEWIKERLPGVRYFDHTTIRNMLIRPLNAGLLTENGELVQGKHEPVWDKEMFHAILNEDKRRKGESTPRGQYLLSGLLECGICGGSVIHITSQAKRSGKNYVYKYYCCKEQHVRNKDKKNQKCSLGYFKTDDLNQLVVETLKKLALSPEEVVKQIQSSREQKPDNSRLIADLENKLAAIDKKLERWYDAFEQGMLNPTQLKDRIQSLEEQKRAVNLRLDEIEEPTEDRTPEVIEVIQAVGQAWDYMTLDEQQLVLRTAIRKIILKPSASGKEHQFVWDA